MQEQQQMTHGAWNDILPSMFQYLETNELVRAVQVCQIWKKAATKSSLWKTVRLNNCKITNWENLKNMLQKKDTQNLILRDIELYTKDKFGANFFTVIPQVTSLIKLELCEYCPTTILLVSEKCPQLKAFSAMQINGNRSLSLGLILRNLKQCQEFRLESKCILPIGDSYDMLALVDNLMPLQQLIHLRHLSLTSIKRLERDIEIIKILTKLETLELGPCIFPKTFGTNVLLQLKQLRRLRLENPESCVRGVLRNIQKLQTLSCLELINLNLQNNTHKIFDNYLPYCKNIKRLLITPTTPIKKVEFDSIVNGIKELSTTLIHFVISVPVKDYSHSKMEIFCDFTGKQVVHTDSAVVVETDKDNTIEYKTESENNKLLKIREAISEVLPDTRVIIIKMMPYIRSYWHPFLTRRTQAE